jgi:AbiV family abortive infection protein
MSKIAIPLDQADEGLKLIAANIHMFIQDHYALMQQASNWHAMALAIFALEELVKYSELKHMKQEALRRGVTSIEVDERLFGRCRKSHEYKLKLAKDQALIPADAWVINSAKFDSAYFGSAYFDTEDVVITAALRVSNLYVDWEERWQIGTDSFEPLRLKHFADSILLAFEKMGEAM